MLHEQHIIFAETPGRHKYVFLEDTEQKNASLPNPLPVSSPDSKVGPGSFWVVRNGIQQTGMRNERLLSARPLNKNTFRG